MSVTELVLEGLGILQQSGADLSSIHNSAEVVQALSDAGFDPSGLTGDELEFMVSNLDADLDAVDGADVATDSATGEEPSVVTRDGTTYGGDPKFGGYPSSISSDTPAIVSADKTHYLYPSDYYGGKNGYR